MKLKVDLVYYCLTCKNGKVNCLFLVYHLRRSALGGLFFGASLDGDSFLRRFVLLSAIILMAIAAGLYVHYSTERGVEKTALSFSLSSESLKRILVKSPTDEYTLEHDDTQWTVSVSSQAGLQNVVADSRKVQDFLDAFSSLIPIDTIVSKGFRNGGDLGFSEIHAHLTVEPSAKSLKKGVQNIDVVLGSRVGSEAVYIWISSLSDKIYRIGEDILSVAKRSAPSFYDKRVIPFDASDVVKLQLAQKYAGGWTVSRGKEGFTFELPAYLEGSEAADAEVRLYLLMLAGLTADEFVTVNVPLPKEPEAFINVWLSEDDSPIRLDLFKDPAPGAGYLATSVYQPGVFRFATESVRQLLKTPFELQGRRVIELDIGKISTIRVTSDTQVFKAEKREAGWFVSNTEKQLAGIDMSLWRFNELKFEALPLKNLPDTASWVMNCTFIDEQGNQVAALNFFSDPVLPEGQSWLKNGGELYYPVSNQLMKDIQGLFPGRAVREAAASQPSAKE